MALPPGLSAFTSDILFALVTRLSQSPWQLNTYTTRDCVDRTTSSGKYQRSLDLGSAALGPHSENNSLLQADPKIVDGGGHGRSKHQRSAHPKKKKVDKQREGVRVNFSEGSLIAFRIFQNLPGTFYNRTTGKSSDNQFQRKEKGYASFVARRI